MNYKEYILYLTIGFILGIMGVAAVDYFSNNEGCLRVMPPLSHED